MTIVVVTLAAFVSVVLPMNAIAAETVETIPTRDGVTVSFIVSAPSGPARAAAILFAGGNGRLRVTRNGGTRSRNFLVRSRELFAGRGVYAVTVDSPSDRGGNGLEDFRGSAEHRADIAALVRWIRARTRAPLWLIGTSRGTISVAYLASVLPIDGAVFSATVTESGSRRPASAHDGDLGRIRVPSLIVHHKGDACRVTPVESLPAFANRLRFAPKVETLLFDGGKPDESEPCQALSAHGFFGIEDKVVDAIVRWMVANGGR